MSYKTTWFTKRDLRRLCQSVANLCDIELTAEMLCDVVSDQIASGGYGANVMEKLLRQGVSREDAEMLLADLSETAEGGYRELFTAEQAAEELGISVQRVKQLCAEGRMGRKVGRDWVISVEDIERNRERPGPGRPPGRAVTQDNVEDIRHEVGFLDLAAEVQVGQRVSVHRFTHEGGQSGCLLVIHADKDGRVDRAGISFGGPASWGDWDEATQTVRLDEWDDEGPVVYRIDGRRVVEE